MQSALFTDRSLLYPTEKVTVYTANIYSNSNVYVTVAPGVIPVPVENV